MPSGLLFNDYNYIFSSMLERDSEVYQKVVHVLCQHNLLRNDILEKLDQKSGGLLTSYIDELEVSGFIARDFTWNLRTGDFSKISQYRLSDNYIRFYTKYILPAIPKIKNGQFDFRSMTSLPGWSSKRVFLLFLQVSVQRYSRKLLPVFDQAEYLPALESLKYCEI